MYIGEFQPADQAESEIFAFDFRKDLATGENLVTAVFTMSVIEGTDPTPSAHLVGPAIISGTQARQRIASLVNGCTYKVQAVVTTNQGNTKSLWGRISSKG